MAFRDGFGREIDYLRISVTDRCNLRCRYCMPAEGVVALRHDDILRYEEIERLARAAAELGISKIRLTGGEPLVRRGIVDLVAALAAIPGIRDLSMTTNGTLLAPMAVSLAQAGLNRVNVSLDTLDAARYADITRGGSLEAALAGIAAAEAAGLLPLKINAVATRGFNDDELAALAALTLEHDWHVRFIELMPLNDGSVAFEVGYIPADEIRAVLRAAYGELIPVATADQPAWNGPAEYVRLPGGRGMVGIITPVSAHFCARCNRLRLTADGKLRMCLFSDQEIDVRAALRSGASPEALQDLLRQAVAAKPAGHHLAAHEVPHDRVMSQIGG